MELALVLLRTGLALVLGTAGLAKLADRAGSRQAMLDFGVSEKLAGPLGLALPVAELIVAVAFIPAATAHAAGLSAALLFVVFLGAMGYQLARGRHPDCHCFGQLHSKPIGPATLVRNGVLLLLAAVVAFNPAPPWLSAFDWTADLGGFETLVLGAILLLVTLVLAEGWMVLNLARQQGRMLLRLDEIEARLNGAPAKAAGEPPGVRRGLKVGAPAPSFELPSLEGPSVSLDQLRAAGKPVLLVSVDLGCGPCTSLTPEVAEWQREHAGALTVAVLTRGSAEANRRKLEPHGISKVLLQKGQEVAEQYEAVATPSAVLIDAEGRIAAPVAAGTDDIRRLVERTVRPPKRRAEGLPVGSPAPPLTLPDLDGVPFDLHARAGQPTVLLFWNPGCGFCRRMLPDLKSWEAGRLADSGLVLVSSGAIEVNREMGLRSTVLLGDDFAVGRSYGASGTPSAVLIDGTGRVASGITVGAPGVLALLERLEPSQAVIQSASHSIP